MNATEREELSAELLSDIAQAIRTAFRRNVKPGGVVLRDDNITMIRASTNGLGTSIMGVPIYRFKGESGIGWDLLTEDQVKHRLRKDGDLLPLFRFKELTNLATEMVQLKHKLGQAGLFKTMHMMDEATRAVGYEIAEKELRT